MSDSEQDDARKLKDKNRAKQKQAAVFKNKITRFIKRRVL